MRTAGVLIFSLVAFSAFSLPAFAAGDTFTDAEVSLVVNQEYGRVYYRNNPILSHSDVVPMHPEERVYWEYRARSDRKSRSLLHGTMLYWYKRGIMPYIKRNAIGYYHWGTAYDPSDEILERELVPRVNTIFRFVFGRSPTAKENQYWTSRIYDRRGEQTLKDTMRYYKSLEKTGPV
jgi:hypothetical protein